MSQAEALRAALRNLRAHKLRASLTMLGMIFGVGAVIAMLSIGAGAEREAPEPHLQPAARSEQSQ